MSAHERPLRVELLLVGLAVRRERAGQAATERVTVVGTDDVVALVGQRQQELLARRELGHLDVDRAVGEHPALDREAERAVEVAGQHLAAHGVAHVVGEQRDPVDAAAATTASVTSAWSSIE